MLAVAIVAAVALVVLLSRFLRLAARAATGGPPVTRLGRAYRAELDRPGTRTPAADKVRWINQPGEEPIDQRRNAA